MFSEEKRDFLHFAFEKSLKSLTFSQKPLFLTPTEITVLSCRYFILMKSHTLAPITEFDCPKYDE